MDIQSIPQNTLPCNISVAHAKRVPTRAAHDADHLLRAAANVIRCDFKDGRLADSKIAEMLKEQAAR